MVCRKLRLTSYKVLGGTVMSTFDGMRNVVKESTQLKGFMGYLIEESPFSVFFTIYIRSIGVL